MVESSGTGDRPAPDGDPPGGPHPSAPLRSDSGRSADDLDALIGDIRREAARRRAAPDFPVDEEAAIVLDMDRQGPVGGADLAGLLAELERLARAGSAHGGAADGSAGAGGAAEVAGLVASVTRTLARRLTGVERRVAAPPVGPTGSAGPAATGAEPVAAAPEGPNESGPDGPPVMPAPATWAEAVLAHLAGPARPTGDPAPTGRLLVAGAGAAEWVGYLDPAAALDVYGVDPNRPEYGDSGPVRSGSVADHLSTVAPGGLAGVLLVGPVPVTDLAALPDVVDRLAQVTARVAVVSEAPWWWQRRVGAPASDLAAGRPVSAETWLALLDGAGFVASARYGTGGRDFLVVAHAPAGGEGSGGSAPL